ncbi:MAG: PorT family protein [Prevotellaceae bacterium]|nr:PorT family protein [Prevotellaceae bacterium]
MLCCTHTAYGKDSYSLGYDADHINYFFRVNVPDKSIQLGFAAGCSWNDATPARPDDFRNAAILAPVVNHLYTGISGEKHFFNMRIALTTGLYFSRLNAYLLAWPSYKGAVYIVDEEDDDMVHYTSVSDVRTVSTYFSIPLELSCALINKPDFDFYLKGGAMANINLNTAASLLIDPSVPEQTRQQLSSYFRSTEAFSINASAGIGIRWGSYASPNFRLELGVPFSFSEHLTYLHVNWGIAARVALYVPLFIFYE